MATPPSHNSGDLEGQTAARRRWFPKFAIVGKNDHGNDPDCEKRLEAAEYGDSSAMYWKLYMSEAEISDQKLVDTLLGDSEAMSIMNSIFSAIIASFIVQTSQALQPGTGQQTVCLLSQLVSQGNSTQPASPSCPDSDFGPPEAAIRSNILLVISFFLAMTSVLACALVHQWCRDFMKFAYPRVAPHKRGRVRTYLFRGVNRFYMRGFMYGVNVLLHNALFLFFCGISDYLHNLHPTVGMVSWYFVFSSLVGYTALSFVPLIIGDFPYQTALTPPLRFGRTVLVPFFGRTVRPGKKGTSPLGEERNTDRSHSLIEEANSDAQAKHLDPYAMKWLFTDDDFSDTDMDIFLGGLPGYIHSHFTVSEGLPKVLTAPYILRRIMEHLFTCATATELSEEARVKRVSACVGSLRVILNHRTSANLPENSDEESLRLRWYMQSIVDGLDTLCKKPDEIRDLRAFCVRALAFQGLPTQCPEPLSPSDKFPDHFIPLYTFFSSQDNTSQAQAQVTVQPPAGVSDEKAPDKKAPDDDHKMWQTVLHDGPLINLTLLARAILSHDDVDPSSLSMCWKTLDILRSEMRITTVDVSHSSSTMFDDVHQETRRRVGAEEPGFSVIPLLEILDAVAGGRRLSMVFRDHPMSRSKADLVFGKDHLRNPDLFRAFATCLPVFVSENPEKSMEVMKFMEDLVCYDYLWTSLQVHLLNALRPNTFIPAMLQVFDTCCTVIDAAFVALENSEIVDWRAPDFGSLAHYFELFVTDCFQGMFVERAIGFRVSLIKARFCKAVLAQFLAEFHAEGTVVFRSHWDVASLARVFYSLGVGDDANVEFWSSFVDGGPIGAELMAKTYTTLDTAARDGSLLNFCKLGQLGMVAVPFEGSGLKDTDFKKLLDLQQKIITDSRLPLKFASTAVWEDLGRLRDDVFDICARSRGKDEKNMQALLANIDAAYSHHPSSTQEHPPSDHVHVQASGTSAVVQPRPGLIPGFDRLSYASTSTAITEDQQDSPPTQEVDFRGIAQVPVDKSRGRLTNVYHTPYPLLPSQIGPGGAITRPFSASFLPTLFPLLESTQLAPSSSTPSNHRPEPPMRYNSQHRRAPVYYPPRGDTPAIWATRSAMLSSLLSPTRVFSSPSNVRFDSSIGNGVYSTPSGPPNYWQ